MDNTWLEMNSRNIENLVRDCTLYRARGYVDNMDFLGMVSKILVGSLNEMGVQAKKIDKIEKELKNANEEIDCLRLELEKVGFHLDLGNNPNDTLEEDTDCNCGQVCEKCQLVEGR